MPNAGPPTPTSACRAATNIFISDRNRPEALTDPLAEPISAEEAARRDAVMEYMQANAVRPAAVADMVHDAVVDKTFWIFTDDDHVAVIAKRHDEIQHRRNPSAQSLMPDF